MVALRDPVGTCSEVLLLIQRHIRSSSARGRMIAHAVASFLDDLPMYRMPNAVDAMRLLERIALKGVKFPGPLIMLSKVMFTLEGILGDVGGSKTGMDLAIAGRLAQHWLSDRKAFRSPLVTRDWITLQCSALLYTARLWMRGEQAMLDRLLPTGSSGVACRLPRPNENTCRVSPNSVRVHV
jgi:hypothetical protein